MGQPRCEVIGECTLWLGDCLTLREQFDPAWAVVTDPPYGIEYHNSRSTMGYNAYAGGAFRTHFAPIIGDDCVFDPTPWLRRQTILWGANNYPAALPPGGWLVWYKAGGVQGFHSSPCELAWTTCTRRIEYCAHLWHGFKRDSESGEKVVHPTQKPVAVMAWCLDFTTGPILDPYMGSGSTGIACVQRGRRFVGCEIDENYYETARRRIEAAYKQPDLFLPRIPPTEAPGQFLLFTPPEVPHG